MDEAKEKLSLEMLRTKLAEAKAQHNKLLANMPSPDNLQEYFAACQATARSTDRIITIEEQIEKLYNPE